MLRQLSLLCPRECRPCKRAFAFERPTPTRAPASNWGSRAVAAYYSRGCSRDRNAALCRKVHTSSPFLVLLLRIIRKPIVLSLADPHPHREGQAQPVFTAAARGASAGEAAGQPPSCTQIP